MKIYYAVLTPTGTDGEYAWSESHDAECGEEWDGDVLGYLLNLADDEEEMRQMINAPFDGAVHNEKNNAIFLTVDGVPSEMWWAE